MKITRYIEIDAFLDLRRNDVSEVQVVADFAKRCQACLEIMNTLVFSEWAFRISALVKVV